MKVRTVEATVKLKTNEPLSQLIRVIREGLEWTDDGTISTEVMGVTAVAVKN